VGLIPASSVPKLSPSFSVQRRPDPAALMAAVVDVLEAFLHTSVQQQQFRPLGLATGRTMEPLYAALCARLKVWPALHLQWLRDHWCSFNLDEYVGLPSGDPCCFAAYMQTHLAVPLDLPFERIGIPDGLACDPGLEARRYSAALSQAGGIGLQLLGLGNNGHVGFNEPPSGFDSPCRVVTLQKATRIQNADAFGGDFEAVPKQAITLGLQEILSAEVIHLIVTGSAKAEILRTALLEPCTGLVPASWLQRHPRVHLWVDDAAHSRLSAL